MDTPPGSTGMTDRPADLARRIRPCWPAVGLVTLSPLTAEYLLGNVTVSELSGLPVLMLVYGCAALGIREAARHTGRGWPTIVILAAAFGVAMPGIIDQSLFNAHFEEWEFQKVARSQTLGIGLYDGLGFVAGHVVWSMAVPIAVVETLVPKIADHPWTGRRGLALVAAGFVLGAVAIFNELVRTEGFLASPAQFAGVGVVVVALVLLAFRRPPRAQAAGPDRSAGVEPVRRAAARPRVVGTSAFVGSSAFVLRPENWWGGVVGGLAVLAAAAFLVTRAARRPGWGPQHRLALAAGAGWTYAWLGFVLLAVTRQLTWVNVVGQVGLVLGYGALHAVAWRRARPEPSRS